MLRLILALALLSITAYSVANGKAYFGSSRNEAIEAENKRFADDTKPLAKEEARVKDEYLVEARACGRDLQCIEQAWKRREERLREIRYRKLLARRAHADRLDAINAHYDKLNRDYGSTNRVDGRDGRRYVDKLPKPPQEHVYPTKVLRGEWHVQLPPQKLPRGGWKRGRWVPAIQQRNGRWVPRDPKLREPSTAEAGA